MEGGGVGGVATEAREQNQNPRKTARIALCESFILVVGLSSRAAFFHVNVSGGEIYSHNRLAQVIRAPAERQPQAAVSGAGIFGIGGVHRQSADGVFRKSRARRASPGPESLRRRAQRLQHFRVAQRHLKSAREVVVGKRNLVTGQASHRNHSVLGEGGD